MLCEGEQCLAAVLPKRAAGCSQGGGGGRGRGERGRGGRGEDGAQRLHKLKKTSQMPSFSRGQKVRQVAACMQG